ncbi:MAG: hypothetical protein ACI8W8_003431 [Rhodothermales bacterium]|jgi:hypothetical protein
MIFPIFVLAALQTALIDLSQNELPNDSGTDRSHFAQEIFDGEPWLRVAFAAGDSVGQTRPRTPDWTPFDRLTFAANNRGAACRLTLVIRHAGSSGYGGRIDHELALPTGRAEFAISLRELRNNDGAAPDLGRVQHWYLHNPGAAREVDFGSVWLRGSAESADEPIPFHTPATDALLAKLQIFPQNDPWHQDIRQWPRHPNSDRIVASIGSNKPLRYNPDMAFIIVPPDQPRVPVRIVDYPGESDPGPFPVPEGLPIEGWPGHGKHAADALLNLQFDRAGAGGDRHAIIVDPANAKLYEFFQMRRTDNGWQAAQASIFDLRTNRPRPQGWTSADAAGLPIFPAVVRYDELARGVINHALRLTVRKSRRAYVAPASHFASRHTNTELPRMGERFRLRAAFDTSGFSREVRIILQALKTHGMLVADNGIEWAVSVTPDPRIPILHDELRRVRGRDFEVVVAPK